MRRMFCILPLVSLLAKAFVFAIAFVAFALDVQAQCAGLPVKLAPVRGASCAGSARTSCHSATVVVMVPVKVQASCSSAATGCSGRVGLVAHLHQLRSDRLQARADFHANRANAIAARRGATVLLVQPAEPLPYPQDADKPKKLP